MSGEPLPAEHLPSNGVDGPRSFIFFRAGRLFATINSFVGGKKDPTLTQAGVRVPTARERSEHVSGSSNFSGSVFAHVPRNDVLALYLRLRIREAYPLEGYILARSLFLKQFKYPGLPTCTIKLRMTISRISGQGYFHRRRRRSPGSWIPSDSPSQRRLTLVDLVVSRSTRTFSLESTSMPSVLAHHR